MKREEIDEIRRFNRFYTRVLELTAHYQLATKHTILENRLLLEIDQGRNTAKQLQELLKLDKGYISRLLKKLTDQGLLTTQPDTADGRAKILVLTPQGAAALADSNQQADEQIKQLFGMVTASELQAVLKGMQDIKHALQTTDEQSEPHE